MKFFVFFASKLQLFSKFEVKKKISEISEFLILGIGQNRKLGNLGKFLSALNFDCFDCIERRKVENFHQILKE